MLAVRSSQPESIGFATPVRRRSWRVFPPGPTDADREAGRLEAAPEADDPFAACFRAAQPCSMIDANGVSVIGITSAVREAFEPQRRA